MFSRNQLLALAVLLLLSVAFHLGPLVVLCLLLLLSATLAWFWKHVALSNVIYTQKLSQHHAFPDDTVELVIEIINRKLLPITALRVQEVVTGGLDWSTTSRIGDWKPARHMLERASSVGAYEALRWRYQLRCSQRGIFRFAPATLEAGDPFGFTTRQVELGEWSELVVYPRVLSLDQLGFAGGRALGEARSRQWLFTDPSLTAGARDYRFGDPLKSIHWPATARRGNLQTRIYEPTLRLELLVFLELDTIQRAWEGRHSNEVERVISAAATVAQWALAERYSTGLIVNGMLEFRQGLIHVPPSRSPTQLTAIFDALARVVPHSLLPMADLLQRETGLLDTGTTVVLVSVIAPDALRSSMLRVRQRGNPTTWVYLGAEPPPTLPGIRVQHVPPAIANESEVGMSVSDGAS